MTHTYELEKKFSGLSLGRITNEQKNLYKIVTENGFYNAKLKGSLINHFEELEEFPRVGDFVAVEILTDFAIIHGIIKRKNTLSKKITGQRCDTHIIGANLDCVFLVMGLNHDYNIRRLERYLSIAQNSNLKYIILLTKVDLCVDYLQFVDECKRIAFTDQVYPISALMGQNMDIFNQLIKPTCTYAFIGSSGAGKSTIVNYLVGQEIQSTMPLSVYEKGKHTTTSRELFLLPNGGIVIDTPGMKAIGVLDDEESIQTSFNDIEALAKDCKFKDCKHQSEPGCKVKAEIENGNLDINRLFNYKKLIKEAKYMEQKEFWKMKQKTKQIQKNRES